MNIFFLIGFMGAGKSYWGKQWAKAAAFPYIELDALIEAEMGKPITRIFLEEGEAFFREKESKLLKQSCLGYENCMVATGGGTPCFFDNMDWMNAHGTTVYIKATPQLLAQRLAGEKAQRPLLHQVNDTALEHYIAHKLAEREPFYGQAKIIAEATDLTVESIFQYKR
jgi:shikimate kinase